MQAHGYGDRTFRIETDAQGKPVVHRVDGKQSDSHYTTGGWPVSEIEQRFDFDANIYLIVTDLSIDKISLANGRFAGGFAAPEGKTNGYVLVPHSIRFFTVAHELGHTFGLDHDFRDNRYIMSYGFDQRGVLSACAAEFLAVNPYFNPAIPIKEGQPPTVELTSPHRYPAGSESVTVQLEAIDPEGIHQVILFATAGGDNVGTGSSSLKTCRGLGGETNVVVEVEYDGDIPFEPGSSLSDPAVHRIVVLAVDTDGDVASRTPIATLAGHAADLVHSASLSPDGTTLASGTSDKAVILWDISEWTSPRPSALEISSGNRQQGAPGAALAQPLVVEVRDQYGEPIPEARVAFTVTSGDGQLSGRFTVEYATTDADGRARLTLTLGPDPGPNMVSVSLRGRELATFHAEGVGTALAELEGDYRTWHLPEGATARLGKGALGEGDRAVALSADGRCLAVASRIGVWLYEAATSRALALLPTEGAVHSVAFALDGTLAAGLNNGRVELWEVETGERIGTRRHADWGQVSAVAFSRDGATLATGSWDQVIKVWDVETGRVVGTWEVPREDDLLWSLSVALSPDGSRLVSGFRDGTVRLWDVATQTEVATLQGHRDRATSVSFSPDGKLLASGGAGGDPTVRLWDAATQTEVATLRGHTSEVLSVSFSWPDGGTLASGARDRTVRLWNLATHEEMATLEEHGGPVRSVTFSRDGATLVSGADEGTVLLRDVETGNAARLSGHGSLFSMALSPDGTLLASGSQDRTVRLWDTATRTRIGTLEGHRNEVGSVSFSPDGALLSSAGGWGDGTVKLWDVGSGALVETLEGHRGSVSSVSFSPDGATLATAGESGDVKIRLWDVVTREPVGILEGHLNSVKSLAFSPPAGALLASGSWDGTVKLWDVATRELIGTLEGHEYEANTVAFSPDGKTLASGSGDTKVRLWDVAALTSIATLQDLNSVHSVAFSPDGKTLVSGSWGTITLWDLGTKRSSATLRGHMRWVHSVAFSRDGATLASGAEDGTMLLWNMQQLKPRPHTLTKVSGGAQQMPAGGLAKPFVVLVQDQNGDPIPGATVTFAVTAGGGILSTTSATTDENGQAATTLTLGSEPGANTVTVSVAGLDPVIFTVTAKATPDFDGDGETSFSDFFLFADAFGGSDPRFDLDGSGIVDFADFFLLADYFVDPARGKLLTLAQELIGLPDGPQLRQNAPNPFNSETVIPWFLLRPGPAHVEVFSLTGQRIAVLHQGRKKAGGHRIHWNGRDDQGRPLASGVYLYRLVTTENVQTRKLTILR